jgi:hypothetical protein
MNTRLHGQNAIDYADEMGLQSVHIYFQPATPQNPNGETATWQVDLAEARRITAIDARAVFLDTDTTHPDHDNVMARIKITTAAL